LLAQSAENLAVIADWTGASPYPFEKLNRAWNLVLGSQFHDILPGTSIPKAYEYAWNDEFVAANGFANVLENSVRELSAFMNTQAKGRSIVVYNALEQAREDIVSIQVAYSKLPKQVQVFNGKGVEVPTQELERTENGIKLIFLAKVPATGMAVYEIREVAQAKTLAQPLKVSANSLENEFYKVELNSKGDIQSIYDKLAAKELLAKPAGLVFLEESPKEWPAWNMDWEDRQNPPLGRLDENVSMQIVENGPMRVAIEVKREGRNSKIKQVISLALGEPGKRLEVANILDWQSKGVSLKADFPLAVSNELATYNIGVGAIERGTNTSNKFEVPSKLWFDLTDKEGGYGITILEDCKYGSDKPSENNLRLTLLYSPENEKWFPVQQTQDWGVHEFRYGIYGHKNSWQEANSALQGKTFNQALLAFEVPKHKGKWNKEKSFLSVSHDEVGVMAFKKMENEDYYMVRLNELSGKDITTSSVAFAGDIADAYEVDGQENRIGDAQFANNQLNFELSHFTIRSFAVKFKAASVSSTHNQASINLPFNTDVITHDKNRSDGEFAHRRSLPSEMLPDVIVSEGIKFTMGSKEDEAKNAVECKGQEISLPQGKFTSMYILAAANEDTKGEVFVDGKSYSLNVQDWSGFIGQHYNRLFEWDNKTLRGIDKPYLKNDNIAWFATHRHFKYPSQNEAYQFSYLFKYELAIPAGAKSIILPDNNKIKIMAITLAEDTESVTPLQPLFDEFTDKNGASVEVR
jgi:alpha-mannosidase